MNLYQINFNHYAPKDNKEGIGFYLLAKDDEEVLAYLIDKSHIYSKEDEGDNEEARWRENILKSHDEEDTGFEDYGDLYYGRHFYSWKSICYAIDPKQVDVLTTCGIDVRTV